MYQKVVQRVTQVEFGLDYRGSDGTRFFRIKIRMYTSEFTDMRTVGLRKYCLSKTKVACRMTIIG